MRRTRRYPDASVHTAHCSGSESLAFPIVSGLAPTRGQHVSGINRVYYGLDEE
jgi:hypothetical protein